MPALFILVMFVALPVSAEVLECTVSSIATDPVHSCCNEPKPVE